MALELSLEMSTLLGESTCSAIYTRAASHLACTHHHSVELVAPLLFSFSGVVLFLAFLVRTHLQTAK